MNRTLTAAVAAALLTAVSVGAQVPGAPDTSRVAAGTYAVDPRHTQVVWTLNHLGFTVFTGIVGGATGTMTLDPANPAVATVSIEVPLSGMTTPVPALNDHLKSADYFDTGKFPTATFKSTSVTISGTKAKIDGTLTLHGVSRPVILDARFVGAGTNPLTKKATVGFDATTMIKRSDFGMTTALPALGDDVDLHIAAAFERAN